MRLLLAALVLLPLTTPRVAAGEDYYPLSETHGGWRTLVAANVVPTNEQKVRLREIAGLDWDRLNEAWTYSRSFGGPGSVIVIRHGWIAGEWFTDTNRRGIASCTKSLTALSVAKLCELSAAGKFDKRITFEDPAWKYLPERWALDEPARKEIAIWHMLTMSSGLVPYDGPYKDLDAYAETILTQPVEAEPGAVWGYASAPVDLLSLVVEDVTGQLLADFFNEQIAAPIGSAPVEFPKFREHSGGSGGPGGGARLAARDMARLGYLLLHAGRWRDDAGEKQVLQPETVARLTQWEPRLTSATYREPNFNRVKDAQTYYGYLFHTNRNHHALGAAVPDDAFYMSGWGKQACWVIPSLDMVVVRLNPHRDLNDHPEYFPEFLSRVMSAVID